MTVVYQVGIANVFLSENHGQTSAERGMTIRVWQGTFRDAEMIARGYAIANGSVKSMYCNQAGDIIESDWSTEVKSAPFSDLMRTVENTP